MRSAYFLIAVTIFSAFSFKPDATAQSQICPQYAKDLLSHSRQLITVMTANWNANHGPLILWERPAVTSPWQMSSKPVDAIIGRNGMAWGFPYATLQGTLSSKSGIAKHEGDGKSPAGVYAFGRRFGFADQPDSSDNYLKILPTTVCIDDPHSSHYNQIVDSVQVAKDWKSAENMHGIDLYRSGVEILYPSDAKAQAGSCIFFHITSKKEKGTSGCTSVSEDAMKTIQATLKSEFKPTIVLLPHSELAKWADCFPGLPMMAGAGGEL